MKTVYYGTGDRNRSTHDDRCYIHRRQRQHVCPCAKNKRRSRCAFLLFVSFTEFYFDETEILAVSIRPEWSKEGHVMDNWRHLPAKRTMKQRTRTQRANPVCHWCVSLTSTMPRKRKMIESDVELHHNKRRCQPQPST